MGLLALSPVLTLIACIMSRFAPVYIPQGGQGEALPEAAASGRSPFDPSTTEVLEYGWENIQYADDPGRRQEGAAQARRDRRPP